jgi:hypothetical protein
LREFASAHRATNPSPDPDRCSQMHRCLAVPVPTFRLRDSLSECYITGRCLPAMTPRVLVMGDEVRTEENFFRRTITINSFTGRSLSARLQGSVRFLAIPIPAPPSIRLAVDLPPAGSDTGLPCSAEMTRSRRCSLYAGSVVLPMTKEFEAHVPTGKKSAEHLPLSRRNDAYESLHMLTI